MTVRDIIYDVLDYITDQKCHGEDIAVSIAENITDMTYCMDLRTKGGFEQAYTFNAYDFWDLDEVRTKVEDMLNDFRDKYEKTVLEAN